MTSEWDKFAQQTYRANYPDGPVHVFFGDITKVDVGEIPDHDVLLAGFPCQPFSIVGRRRGFDDPTQGTLFFDTKRIIERKRPKAFLLENVKNLRHHDKGRTFQVIRRSLTELGYRLHVQVLDGVHFVPQKRERIFIAGFRDDTDFDFDTLPLPPATHTVGQILHTKGEPWLPHDEGRFFDPATGVVPERYTKSARAWAGMQAHAARHAAKGNGFGYGLVTPGMTTRTLVARYHSSGAAVLVEQPGGRPRALTPRECARLQGFPDSFRIPVSNTQAYKQFGNSVVVPLVGAIAKHMTPHIHSQGASK